MSRAIYEGDPVVIAHEKYRIRVPEEDGAFLVSAPMKRKPTHRFAPSKPMEWDGRVGVWRAVGEVTPL